MTLRGDVPQQQVKVATFCPPCQAHLIIIETWNCMTDPEPFCFILISDLPKAPWISPSSSKSSLFVTKRDAAGQILSVQLDWWVGPECIT